MHLQENNSRGETSKFYSVIADEVTDTVNKEELSLILRFVLNGTVEEVFVDFGQVYQRMDSPQQTPEVSAMTWSHNNFVPDTLSQERMMTSLFFHGGGGRACDFVFSRGESRIFRVY